jgi:small subunit ribosomal protein S26e
VRRSSFFLYVQKKYILNEKIRHIDIVGKRLIRRFKAQKLILPIMPKKRTSRGRTKGGKGSSGTVHCSQCGAMVPRDKAKKVTGRITFVEPTLARELRAQGAYIAPSTDVKFYCVSCAVHRGIVKVRSEMDRRRTGRLH